MKIGIVGAGHWGSQYIRNFTQINQVLLAGVLDPTIQTHPFYSEDSGRFTQTRFCTELDEFLSLNLDAVVIATPASSHFQLAQQFLKQGIHCLVEKPLCLSSIQAKELRDLAQAQDLVLMVGHTLLYSAEVQHLKRMISEGAFGSILSAQTQRLNLGRVQGDCNVIWDLAPHDISVLLYLVDSEVSQVYCQAKQTNDFSSIDYASMQLKFANGAMANLNFSWIDPHKSRTITLVGEHASASFDDCQPSQSLKIYPKSDSSSSTLLKTSTCVIPQLNEQENLRELCLGFVESIQSGVTPLSHPQRAVQICQIIETAHQSLELSGQGVSQMKDFITSQ